MCAQRHRRGARARSVTGPCEGPVIGTGGPPRRAYPALARGLRLAGAAYGRQRAKGVRKLQLQHWGFVPYSLRLGTVLGPKRAAAVPAGDSALRTLAGPTYSREVRATLKGLGLAVDVAVMLGQVPPTLRKPPASIRGGKHAVPQAAWCKRGDIFIDLFGGVGHVVRCVSQRGGPNSIVRFLVRV